MPGIAIDSKLIVDLRTKQIPKTWQVQRIKKEKICELFIRSDYIIFFSNE
jgi:hypothetical protein